MSGASLSRCRGCAAELPADALACPLCRTLRYTDRLRELAAQAEAAFAAGDTGTSLQLWRDAQVLLPRESCQFAQIQSRLEAISSAAGKRPALPPLPVTGPLPVPATGSAPPAPSVTEKAPRRKGVVGAVLTTLGAAALLLWKLKFIVIPLLSKAKLLILGLGKLPTLLSMLLSAGVYWTVFGWKFALGLVISIYIHEMGHVFALNRYGIRATAPMFIPGLGAVIRLKQYPASPRENARVGLAGPAWGLGAAVGAYGVSLATGWASWAAIAHLGAWINLFNLIPLFGLDGAHGFASLTRLHRWIAVAFCGLAMLATQDGMLVLITLVGAIRAGTGGAKTRDNGALFSYVFLVLALSAMLLIEVPGIPRERAPIFAA